MHPKNSQDINLKFWKRIDEIDLTETVQQMDISPEGFSYLMDMSKQQAGDWLATNADPADEPGWYRMKRPQ